MPTGLPLIVFYVYYIFIGLLSFKYVNVLKMFFPIVYS